MAASSDPLASLPPAPAATLPDPELDRLRGEVQKSRNTIEDLKRKLTAPPAPVAQPQPASPMSKTELTKMFYNDPVQNVVDIARQVVQDSQRQNDPSQATLIRVAKDSVRNKDDETRRLFAKYESEIEANVQTSDPRYHTNINLWENAYRMTIGGHMDEILKERGQEPPLEPNRAPAVHISSGAGPSAPSSRPASPPAATQLSAEEKNVAKRLGLSEDQYRAGRKAYDEQNDPQRDPVGKSSWDGLITFSTKELRRRQREARKGAA